MSSTPEPMSVEFLRYNHWANLRLFDACLSLETRWLNCTAPGTYGTVYHTLKHIAWCEAEYLNLLTGKRIEPPFSWDANPPLAEIRPYMDRVGRALVESAKGTQAVDVVAVDAGEGEPFRCKALAILIQIVNHGVEHRTNVTTIMAGQGLQPPGIDGWNYMGANLDRLG